MREREQFFHLHHTTTNSGTIIAVSAGITSAAITTVIIIAIDIDINVAMIVSGGMRENEMEPSTTATTTSFTGCLSLLRCTGIATGPTSATSAVNTDTQRLRYHAIFDSSVEGGVSIPSGNSEWRKVVVVVTMVANGGEWRR